MVEKSAYGNMIVETDICVAPGEQEDGLMAEMVARICAYEGCKGEFMARVADVKRGWAKFCSKRCKACEQEARTGQNAEYKRTNGLYRGD